MVIFIRPHHLLDVLRDYGYGIRYEPHEYGHALHIVAERMVNDPDQEIVLVVAEDDICRPCRHLHADGFCDDTMLQNGETVSKQAYNDALDRRLWAYLGLEGGNRMTVRDFLARVRDRLDGIEDICTHPGEEKEYRKIGLVEGWKKLRPTRSMGDKMGGIERTTRICSVNQLNPNLLRAFRDYFQAYKLGDPTSEAVLCSETITDRQGRSRLANWLEGYPDMIDYLGMILTGKSLLWARTGEQSGTVIILANLNEISARPYATRFSKESGLELCGWIDDEKKKKKNVSGHLALGSQEDAHRFVDAVVQAVTKANPPPKKREIPWLKWWPKREDKQDR